MKRSTSCALLLVQKRARGEDVGQGASQQPAPCRAIVLVDAPTQNSKGTALVHALATRGVEQIVDLRTQYGRPCAQLSAAYVAALQAARGQGVAYSCFDWGTGATGGEVLERLSGMGIDAVLSLNEPSAETTDFVAEELGIAGNGTALSTARRDKLAMQARLRECGLPTIPTIDAENAEQAIRHIEAGSGYPVLLKPSNGTGTFGVRVCRDAASVRACFDEFVGQRVPGISARSGLEVCYSLLVQEYVEGSEYVVNCTSRAGQHRPSSTAPAAPTPGHRRVEIRKGRLAALQTPGPAALERRARRRGPRRLSHPRCARRARRAEPLRGDPARRRPPSSSLTSGRDCPARFAALATRARSRSTSSARSPTPSRAPPPSCGCRGSTRLRGT